MDNPEAPVTPSVSHDTPGALPTPAAQAAPSVGTTVIAPLPGVIKSVSVMDNIIRVRRDGTVETLHTYIGSQVACDEHLLAYARSVPA